MMNETDIPQLQWFKSSKSSPNGQCTMCARLSERHGRQGLQAP